MAKRKGRKQQPKPATSKNTNNNAKIEIIEETDEGACKLYARKRECNSTAI